MIRAIASFVVGVTMLQSTCWSSSLQEWEKEAFKIITVFEGSSYGAVTADFDCQGLTLGKSQWTLATGSMRQIFERLSEVELNHALSLMPTIGAEFRKVVALSLEGKKAEAASLSRKWQSPALVGDCISATRGKQGVRLDPVAKKEIEAFLTTDAVIAAQNEATGRGAKRALKHAACWAKLTRGAWVPDFREFVLFYDIIIQNGERWISQSELHVVAKNIILVDFDGGKREERLNEKVSALADWYSAMATHALRHEFRLDAAANAAILREEFAAGRISDNQVRLLYLAWMKAVLGRNVFSYVTANRKMIILLGRGMVNRTPHDFRQILSGASQLSAAQIDGYRDEWLKAGNVGSDACFAAG